MVRRGLTLSALLRVSALAILATSSLLAQGCAHGREAALYDVGLGASAEVQALSSRAAAGDKLAQYELGLNFELGTGVAQDIGRAIELYSRAAAESDGTMLVYSPPVGKHSGKVTRIRSGLAAPGVTLAAERLRDLRARVAK
jgi:TPR repeat protein